MAIKLPTIPEIEEPSELINLVANSALYKERMTALVDIYGKIKTGLDQFNRLNAIDNLEQHSQAVEAETKAKQAEANRLMDEARHYVSDLKERASEEVALKFARLRMEESRINQMASDVEKREAAATKSSEYLDERRTELAKRIGDCVDRERAAAALKAEYEDKLSKLKALV